MMVPGRELKKVNPELRKTMECPGDQIAVKIPAASEAALHGILMNPACTRDHVLMILKRRPLPESVIKRISESGRWSANHKVRTGLVNHPSTETGLGMGLLRFLFWRDLARVAGNPQIKPRIRRKAEQILVVRSDKITLGERISLARMAPRNLILHLRKEVDPAVVRSLLDNSRVTEKDVVAIVNHSKTPIVLQCVGEHHQWGQRYSVRMALLGNRSIPIQIALRILPSLPLGDVEGLARNSRTRRVVRVAARRLLAEGTGKTRRKRRPANRSER